MGEPPPRDRLGVRRGESIRDWFMAPTCFARLARTHLFAVAGDSAVTVALAGTVFFSLDVNQAAGKVALSLLLTVAPFSVVAPFLGPAIDRLRGGRKLMLLTAAVLRALVSLGMARYLDGFWLFPLAFLTLVLSKAGTVARASLVGTTVESNEQLVTANSRITLLSTAASGVGGGLGIVVTRLAGPSWALIVSALLFGCAAVASFWVREPRTAKESQAIDEEREIDPESTEDTEAWSRATDTPVLLTRTAPDDETAETGAATGVGARTAPEAPLAPTGGIDPALDPRAGPIADLPPAAVAARHHTHLIDVASDDGSGLVKPVPHSMFAPGVAPAAVAMASLRFVVGFLTFMLAFGYRRLFTQAQLTVQFGLVVGAAGVGLFLGSVIAPRLRGHLAEELMVVASLAAVVVAGAVSYEVDHVASMVLLAIVINLAASSGRLAFDSLVQRDNPDAAQGRAFASFEAMFQLVWVVGALIPVLIPVPLALGSLLIAGVSVAGGAAYVATLRHMRRLGFRTSVRDG